jgi:hypothetical protein
MGSGLLSLIWTLILAYIMVFGVDNIAAEPPPRKSARPDTQGNNQLR